MPEVKEGRLAIDEAGHEVFYKLFGQGAQTLVGLAGGPGCSHDYIAGLGELAEGDLQVLLYDQLGTGKSDRPEDESLWRIERFSQEVETLRTKLGLGRIHLYGHSWGGWLAQQYALDYPDGLKSLILAGTSASIAEYLASARRHLLSLPRHIQRTLLKYEARQDWDNPEMAEAALPFYYTHIYRSTPFDPERSLKEFNEILGPVFADIGPQYPVMWGPFEFVCTGNLIDWDVTDRLGEIKVPTLVVGGWYDAVDPECHRTLSEGIPETEYVLFGQSSHCIMAEKEAPLYFAVIKNFVKRAMAR
ncbi:MAG: proline iminopeptidase-family hydrolase [Deltaproteobacteria bacterium]|nr:proline iminopeptidase-family hydrolase [Deltaproteobacteria bacterium]